MHGPETIEERAGEAAKFLAQKLASVPRVGVVLGTGWSGLVEGCDIKARVGFEEIPGFGAVTAPGQSAAVSLLETSAGPVLVQEGRFHCYEGYSSLETTFPVWVYEALGVKAVILTSAVGALNPTYLTGDLIVLRDHIAIFGTNPLIGLPNSSERGRYLITGEFYNERWQDVLRSAVPPEGRCESGVYAWMTGPSFETEAESSLLRIAGADVVGMSTVAEAITARYLGLEVGAICCVSNTILPFRTGGDDVGSLLANVDGAVRTLEGFLDNIAAAADMIG